MKISLISSVLIAGLSLAAHSGKPLVLYGTSDDALKTFQENSTVVQTVSELPLPVKVALADAFHQKSLQMADPGKPFNVTDVVDQRYPMRRLIFAGVNGVTCLVHYEKGGIAHSFHAAIFRTEKGKATLIWSAYFSTPARSISQLKILPHDERSGLD